MNTQKVDGISLKMFEMIIALFKFKNKKTKLCFFEKTFFIANLSINLILKMLFLRLNDVQVYFLILELFQKAYITTTRAIKTTKSIELIEKKEFAVIALKFK